MLVSSYSTTPGDYHRDRKRRGYDSHSRRESRDSSEPRPSYDDCKRERGDFSYDSKRAWVLFCYFSCQNLDNILDSSKYLYLLYTFLDKTFSMEHFSTSNR